MRVSVQECFCITCGAANSSSNAHCFACGAAIDQTYIAQNESLPAPVSSPAVASTLSSVPVVVPPAPGILVRGRYRIISTVGQGGFATVYEAKDTQQQKTVAIKVISLRALKPQEVIDATDTYNREIQFGTSVKHPSLPKIYDHFMDQDHWYIVVEFIAGTTLENYLENQSAKRLSIKEVLSIGVQLCDVLDYLHTRHPPVIFRDVKPDNIMRTDSGRVFLIDFGIARYYRPGRGRDTQALGSPGYAAPEQYGTSQTSARSDIYALGSTLRALLTGVNPLDAEQETLDDAVLATIPQDLDALLTAMLEREPEKRPASAKAVRQQLEQIATENNIELPTIVPAPLARKSSLRALSSSPSVPVTSRRASAPVPQKRSARSVWQRLVVVASVLLTLSGVVTAFATGLISLPGSQSNLTKLAEQQKLVIDLPYSSSISTLDPAKVDNTEEKQIASMIYAGLVQRDNDMRIKPDLAESWVRSEDGMTWSFTLRAGLTFSDGAPLTAQHVIKSIDRALDPQTASRMVSYYLTDTIADAKLRLVGELSTLVGHTLLAPDDRTVVIKTARSIAYLPQALTCPCALVLPTTSYRFSDLEKIPGHASGPFMVANEDPSDSGLIELKPNPKYYGSRPRLASVTFQNVPDVDLEDGEISDRAHVLPLDVWDADEADKRKDFHKASLLWTEYYAMNYLARPFNNVKIRQAFALALNKDSLAQGIDKGDSIPTNHLIPMGQDGYNPALSGPAGVSDIGGHSGLAKKLLAEGMQEEGIGHIDLFPPVTLTYIEGGEEDEKEVQSARRMWEYTLGIPVQLQPLSYEDFEEAQDETRNNGQGLQMWRSGWIADYSDPQNWTSAHFGKNGPENDTNYGLSKEPALAERQQQVQQLLSRADEASNPQERTQLYQQAETMLVEDVAWIPLYQRQAYYLLSPHVKGYMPDEMGIVPPADWAKIHLVTPKKE